MNGEDKIEKIFYTEETVGVNEEYSEEEDDSDEDELDSEKEKLERELDGYEGVSDDDGEVMTENNVIVIDDDEHSFEGDEELGTDLGTDGAPKGSAFLQHLRQTFQEIF